MKSLVALGSAAFLLALVFGGWLWLSEPELEVAEPAAPETVGSAEVGEPPALSPQDVEDISRAFEEAAAELRHEFEPYQGTTREEFDRALREFRLSSWPVTWERAQGFEDWDRDEVWELGVDRYGWHPGDPPAGRTRERMLERMEQDVRFENYEDSLGYRAVRERGYRKEDR